MIYIYLFFIKIYFMVRSSKLVNLIYKKLLLMKIQVKNNAINKLMSVMEIFPFKIMLFRKN